MQEEKHGAHCIILIVLLHGLTWVEVKSAKKDTTDGYLSLCLMVSGVLMPFGYEQNLISLSLRDSKAFCF